MDRAKLMKQAGKEVEDYLPQFTITKGSNDWKFEFSISNESNLLIRSKIYSKTAD